MSTIKSSSEHLTLNADGASKDIKFQANGVEKASIDSSGNLTVSGNLTSVGIDDNADATAITIDASENVGIGTSSPNYKLKVVGDAGILNLENTSASSYEHLRFTVGSANARIVMTGESFADANYGQGDLTLQTETSGGKIRFGTGASGVNKMIIGDDGISFNGDTAAANALDDYEEGTWTASVSGGTQTVSANNNTTYTKVGNAVHLNIYFNLTNVTDSTSLTISGLPFAASGYGGLAAVQVAANATSRVLLTRVTDGASEMNVYYGDGAEARVPQTTINGHFICSLTYQTSA